MKHSPPVIVRYLLQPASGRPRLLASTNDDTLPDDLASLVDRFVGSLASVPLQERTACMECLPAANGTATLLRGLDRGLAGVWHIPKVLFHGLPDPFFWADAFPIDTAKRGDLPAFAELPVLPEKRQVERMKEQFKAGDGAFLMGGAQALVDSCKVRIQRDKPDFEAVRTLWNFLPESTRRTVAFSTWTDDSQLVDGLSIVSTVSPAVVPGYLTEDQCRDYPESTYEKQLQYAIDYSDQKLLDKLMRRRSSKETLSLAIWMVGIAFAVLVVMKVLFPPR